MDALPYQKILENVETEEAEETYLEEVLKTMSKHLNETEKTKHKIPPQFIDVDSDSSIENCIKNFLVNFDHTFLDLKAKQGECLAYDSRDIEAMLDPLEILQTLGISQKIEGCVCTKDTFMFHWSDSILELKLEDYKPVEFFFFNLQRALLMPQLSLNVETQRILEEFNHEFLLNYKKIRKLMAHLASDSTILKDTIRQLGRTPWFPENLKPMPNHECVSKEAQFIFQKKWEFDKGTVDMPYFIFGIWEEYFLNYANKEELGELEDDLMACLTAPTRKIWEMARDLSLIKEKYTILMKIFLSDKKIEEFPMTECAEALSKMQMFDNAPHPIRFAIIGNDLNMKEKIVSWLLSSTQSCRIGNSLKLTYERKGKLVEVFLYFLSSDDFRVCSLDCIIYSDYVKYPQMHAQLKHLVRGNVYCNNREVQGLDTRVFFLDFSSKMKTREFLDTWAVLDHLTTDIFIDVIHRYNYIKQ